MSNLYQTAFDQVIKDSKEFSDLDEAFEYCIELYDKLTGLLVENNDAHVHYPYIGLAIKSDDGTIDYHGNTITHPSMLREIYISQIKNIIKDKKEYCIVVGESYYPMSLAFVCEDLFNSLTHKTIRMPCILRIRKGMQNIESGKNIKRIGFFHAERIDYCLNRLHHYCGSHTKHFQSNIIFTNYKMYVDFFIEDGKKMVDQGEYECIIGPDMKYENGTIDYINHHLPQMPAYHLVRKDGNGITIVNVGVGPSNSKNITDHLAVLSPKSWIILGHCAGLDEQQRLGDYVIGTNHARYADLLDKYVSNDIPIHSSKEICEQLERNIAKHKLNGEKVHSGTVITTADRNWELDCDMVDEFINSQAIAIDMESGIIATNAHRFSIPCATFLCISDMPLHGRLKLRGMAKRFYQTKVRHHFNIVIFAIKSLTNTGNSADKKSNNEKVA